ncbi:50S ribosomal protein L6 [Candidatus Halobeggiatoa sp. HSG11]|nr:50S ribosomal protein L6 [Candidatus Halobeggiatoa sp. HSG11]
MSRIAKKPIIFPTGVEVSLTNLTLLVKGKKGQLEQSIHTDVEINLTDNVLTFVPQTKNSAAMAGTMRAIVNNMVEGVNSGFEKKLNLVGVGYRAQVEGKNLNLTLGFSHPITFAIPDGINIETPIQTEILVKGMDKQQVGQVAANIRAFRPPEPYKGKGVKYADEIIIRKEAKKK